MKSFQEILLGVVAPNVAIAVFLPVTAVTPSVRRVKCSAIWSERMHVALNYNFLNFLSSSSTFVFLVFVCTMLTKVKSHHQCLRDCCLQKVIAADLFLFSRLNCRRSDSSTLKNWLGNQREKHQSAVSVLSSQSLVTAETRVWLWKKKLDFQMSGWRLQSLMGG